MSRGKMKLSCLTLLLILSTCFSLFLSYSLYAQKESKKSGEDQGGVISNQWVYFIPLNFSIGFGSGTDVGYGKKNTSLILSFEAFPIAFSIPALNNIGISTALYESWYTSAKGPQVNNYYIPQSETKSNVEWSNKGVPSSWFPIYIYYPLYSKVNLDRYYITRSQGVEGTFLSPFVHLYFGGSAWGTGHNYFHLGVAITWSFYGPGLSERVRSYTIYNTGFQTGLFYSSGYTENGQDIKGTIGFLITYRVGIGAVFPRK